MQEVNADPHTGIAPGMEDLTEEDARNFYEQCRQHVRDLIYLENGHGAKVDSAVAQAEMLYDKVQMPFSYYPYISTDAIEYTGLCVLFLVLIGMILMVPLFASDRQTQADQDHQVHKIRKTPARVSQDPDRRDRGDCHVCCRDHAFSPGHEQSDRMGEPEVISTDHGFGGRLPSCYRWRLEVIIAAAGNITLLATVCFTFSVRADEKCVRLGGHGICLFPASGGVVI